jgi:L-malate glycosyltransferase
MNVPVYSLGRQPGFQPSLGWSIARLARQHHASIVHCHHYSPFVYGCVAKLWKPGLRLIFTEHGRLSDAKPSGRRRLANQVLGRLPHAVYAVSAELRQHMLGEGLPSAAVGVIYNGIEPGSVPGVAERQRVRQRLGVAEDVLVVGTIARLDPVKDLGTLIGAVAEAGQRVPVVVVVIGDGPERTTLESLARSVSGSDGVRSTAEARGAKVVFLGQRDDAREWLAGCDVYVNSSISEGVSLTILEAMAAGLPVIATRVGGTPEVVDDTCGLLVPARDPERMASALIELAFNQPRRQRLGVAARTRVEERFSLSRMVQEYHDVYRRLS